MRIFGCLPSFGVREVVMTSTATAGLGVAPMPTIFVSLVNGVMSLVVLVLWGVHWDVVNWNCHNMWLDDDWVSGEWMRRCRQLSAWDFAFHNLRDFDWNVDWIRHFYFFNHRNFDLLDNRHLLRVMVMNRVDFVGNLDFNRFAEWKGEKMSFTRVVTEDGI